MANPQEGQDSCPECDCDVELEGYDFDVGETINCPECTIEHDQHRLDRDDARAGRRSGEVG